MTQVLKKTGIMVAGLLGYLSQAGEIIHLTDEDSLDKLREDFDYAVVDFHRGEGDRFLRVAMEEFEAQVQQGAWPARSIGWYRINVAQFPSMSFEEIEKTGQMVIGRDGDQDFLDFHRDKEITEAESKRFASTVKDETKEWVLPISCYDIQSEGREKYDEVVYFGDKTDVLRGGIFSQFEHLAFSDNLNFGAKSAGFYYNNSAVCREQIGLDPAGQQIVIFCGELDPVVINMTEENLDQTQLMKRLNIAIVKATPEWGTRAIIAIFQHFQTAIIYLTEKEIYKEDIDTDWRVNLMSHVHYWIQGTEATLIPIIWSLEEDADLDPEASKPPVPPLNDILQIEADSLPMLLLYNPISKLVFKFPDPLTDIQTVSPVLVALWALEQDLRTEISQLEMALENDKTEEEEKKFTDSLQKYEIQAYVERLRFQLSQRQIEYERVKEYLLIENEFAEEFQASLEAAGQTSQEPQEEEAVVEEPQMVEL